MRERRRRKSYERIARDHSSTKCFRRFRSMAAARRLIARRPSGLLRYLLVGHFTVRGGARYQKIDWHTEDYDDQARPGGSGAIGEKHDQNRRRADDIKRGEPGVAESAIRPVGIGFLDA